jgi:hypothetical protein
MMKTKHGFRGFFGVSVKLPLALAVLLMFAVSACDDGPDSGKSPTKYTVSFNANGGTVSPSDVKVESGKTAKSLPTPVKTSGDTIFWGWYTKTGTGDDWGSPFTAATPVTADITVYARWGNTAPPTLYTVTFNANGGTVSPSSVQVESGKTATSLPTPVKTSGDTIFFFWYTKNGTTRGDWGNIFTTATPVTADITVYAQWRGNPVEISKNVQLTEANWKAILTEIETAGKYVNLDLSQCTRSGQNAGGGLRSDGTFDPLYDFSTGKNRVVSLILPNAATSIAASFRYFFNLTSVSSPTVTDIGDFAFGDCTSLVSASFPAATEIGRVAFGGCTGLTSVSFSASAIIIGPNPFQRCTSLTSIVLTGSSTLTVIEGGKALVRNNSELIAYPSANGNVTLNNITSIGDAAFSGCTGLISVNFPAVTEIGVFAFGVCTSLSSASFPAATSINMHAFFFSGTTPMTFIFGPTAPADISPGLFLDTNYAKTVTVKVPAGATGYGEIIPQTYSGDDTTENWGNGFRGAGWTGTSFNNASGINSNITLHIQHQ